MGNRYYDPGQQRAEKVQALFAAIARRYDRLNDLQSFGLHRRWKRRLVRLSAAGPGTRALDVCCGTGDIAFLLAATGAEVVGLDFSEAMLAVARERAARWQPNFFAEGMGTPPRPPQFIRADALRLPFPADTFDVVTIGYGLRNLADRETGLREMHRVARPGGRMLILDFGKPENPLWRSIYFAYLRLVVPGLGKLVARDAAAYAYILESLHHYPSPSEVTAALQVPPLVDVRAINLLGGIMSIHVGRKPSPAIAHAD